MFPHQETAPEWLARVARDAPNDDARRAAKSALSDWYALLGTWERSGAKTRRSLWDLLSGIRRVEGFPFPRLAEACHYRGVSEAGALVTHVPPHAHRRPQVEKWGPKLRT